MLEILLLVYLCKRLGAMLRAKGRSAGWYQLLLVVAWFGGELLAGIGAVIVTRDAGLAAYLAALFGAACGATAIFFLAHSLAPVAPQQFGAFPVVGTGRSPAPPI